jgi:predicted metal-dependent HD superfamily phosphohydrolase
MEQLKSVTLSVLISLNISEKIASEWIQRIMAQYSEKNRYYHNVEMLEKKMELIEELSVSNEALKNSLALASVFQYFHFDGKSDHKEENCNEFRLFVDQAGIKDVR